jgi:hypothetical protein
MDPLGSQGCWIDVFELSHFRARCRRLFGPADWPNVRSRLPAWGVSIDSLIVGPHAHVRLYRSADPASTVLWLAPDQLVNDVAELNVADDVDSLEIVQQKSSDRQSPMTKPESPSNTQ